MALVQPGFTGSAQQPAGVSRLLQMQARFQQKQMQEKEQKLLQMYENQQQRTLERVTRTTSLSSSLNARAAVGYGNINGNPNNNSNGLGGGRVRQLLEEQRRKPNNSAPAAAGYDRSYPLEPLARNITVQKGTKTRGAASLDRNGLAHSQKPAAPTQQQLNANAAARRTRSQARPPPPPDSPPPEEDSGEPEEPSQSDDDFDVINHNGAAAGRFLDDLSPPPSPPPVDELDDTFVFKRLPNVGGAPIPAPVTQAVDRADRFKTYNAGKTAAGSGGRATPARAAAPRGSPQAAAAPKQQPPVRGAAEPRRKSEQVKTNAPAAAQAAVKRASAPRSNSFNTNKSNSTSNSVTNTPRQNAVSPRSVSNRMKKANDEKMNVVQSVPSSKPKAPLRPSASAPPRDDLVECTNCGRRFAEDRVAKHEEICRKTATKKRKVFDPVKQRVKGTEAEAYIKKSARGQAPKKDVTVKKPDWRRKHEEFINAIRAAKEMKAHLAAGGKLSDLPPPPPLDTSDYIQCPHCQRRFNEAAAERHIPRCADMKHNKKPVPVAKSKAGGLASRRR